MSSCHKHVKVHKREAEGDGESSPPLSALILVKDDVQDEAQEVVYNGVTLISEEAKEQAVEVLTTEDGQEITIQPGGTLYSILRRERPPIGRLFTEQIILVETAPEESIQGGVVESGEASAIEITGDAKDGEEIHYIGANEDAMETAVVEETVMVET